jgi:hypothetical protein
MKNMKLIQLQKEPLRGPGSMKGVMLFLSVSLFKNEPSSSWKAEPYLAGFPMRRPWFEPRPGHVGFVADKAALVQVFSEYSGFPYQFSFHRLLHTHHLSSGAGTIGQTVADVPSRLRLTPHQETKKKKLAYGVREININ